MTTFTWHIDWMRCVPQSGNNSNIVVAVGWTVTGTNTVNGKEYTQRVYNSCSMPEPTGEFLEYSTLTQDQVLSWCWSNGVDRNAAETAVETMINNAANPPIITPPLPWL